MSCDPRSSAVVMQILAEEGGKTGVRSSATLLEITAAPALRVTVLLRAAVLFRTRGSERSSGGVAVFLNTRGRFEAANRRRFRPFPCSMLSVFHPTAQKQAKTASYLGSSPTSPAGGGSQTQLPPISTREKGPAASRNLTSESPTFHQLALQCFRSSPKPSSEPPAPSFAPARMKPGSCFLQERFQLGECCPPWWLWCKHVGVLQNPR